MFWINTRSKWQNGRPLFPAPLGILQPSSPGPRRAPHTSEANVPLPPPFILHFAALMLIPCRCRSTFALPPSRASGCLKYISLSLSCFTQSFSSMFSLTSILHQYIVCIYCMLIVVFSFLSTYKSQGTERICCNATNKFLSFSWELSTKLISIRGKRGAPACRVISGYRGASDEPLLLQREIAVYKTLYGQTFIVC